MLCKLLDVYAWHYLVGFVLWGFWYGFHACNVHLYPRGLKRRSWQLLQISADTSSHLAQAHTKDVVVEYVRQCLNGSDLQTTSEASLKEMCASHFMMDMESFADDIHVRFVWHGE